MKVRRLRSHAGRGLRRLLPHGSSGRETARAVARRNMAKGDAFQDYVRAFTAAGFADLALEPAGNFVHVTPVGVADAAHPCREPSRRHSHFFTADGQFGSLDENGNQVDEGTYEIVAPGTIVIPYGFEEGPPIPRHIPLPDPRQHDRLRSRDPDRLLDEPVPRSGLMERRGGVAGQGLAASRLVINGPSRPFGEIDALEPLSASGHAVPRIGADTAHGKGAASRRS